MVQTWLGIEGQVVIVTGGASGIGKHVVETLQKAGATAVIADVTVNTGDELDGSFCVKCDVTSKDSVEAMVKAVVDKYGKVDALVNNAGVNLPRLLAIQPRPISETTRSVPSVLSFTRHPVF